MGNCCFRRRGYEPINSGYRYYSPKPQFIETNKLRVSRSENGQKIINQYIILKTLDRGSSGKVKLAKDMRTNEYFVLYL